MKDIKTLINYKNIHFIGVGGVSMSALAETMNYFGYTVTGSDRVSSDTTDKLINDNINVLIGHELTYVSKADLVVYTAAIPNDDPELIYARENSITSMERADFLGLLTRAFKETICISGTHGKTTTTSMIATCFLNANLEPNVQVGADLSKLNGNYAIGKSEYFILEACEYVESFLKFFPKLEVILNIDNDHLDYFKNFENIKNAFIKYVKLIPDDGYLVINGDDSNCLDLKQYTNSTILTYGINNTNSDFIAKDIKFDNNGFAEFDVYFRNNFYTHINLSVCGMHNVLNSLACICVCYFYNIPIKTIQSSLKEFTGAHRRLEFKGKYKNVSIFDDYAHHPTEIKASVNALKNKTFNQSWVVFQPHTYSRTKNLLSDFANALINYDNIIITDIYAAREKNTYNISAQDLADKIQSIGKKVNYIHSFEDIAEFLKNNVNDDDIVVTQGAGPIYEVGNILLNK